jgi:agmatinase
MQIAYETLLARHVKTEATSPVKTKTGRVHPRIVTLGGDHAVVYSVVFCCNMVGPTGFTSTG